MFFNIRHGCLVGKDHSKVIKLHVRVIQIAKSEVLGHFMEFDLFDRLHIADLDRTKCSSTFRKVYRSWKMRFIQWYCQKRSFLLVGWSEESACPLLTWHILSQTVLDNMQREALWGLKSNVNSTLEVKRSKKSKGRGQPEVEQVRILNVSCG